MRGSCRCAAKRPAATAEAGAASTGSKSGTFPLILTTRSDTAPSKGLRDVNTTLTVYAHLINTDNHAGNLAALGALAAPKPTYGGNVVPLHC